MRILTLGLLLPMLAACGGGATLSTPAQPAIPNGTLSGESILGTLQQPQYVSSPADLLYVANDGNNSITVFRHDVSGNASPLKVISGSNTGIDSPGQLAEDAQGNLYVANSVYDNASILVFAHGANGNVSPIRKIAGPLTGLQYIEAMTVDQQTGKIFVIDDPMVTSQRGYASLVRFPPNANGNEAPFARSPQNLGSSSEIANDSTGNNIIQTADSSIFYFDIPNVGLSDLSPSNRASGKCSPPSQVGRQGDVSGAQESIL